MDYYSCERCGKQFDEFEMNFRLAQIDKKCWCKNCRELGNSVKERTAEDIYEFIEHFNDIKEKEPSKEDIVTYYCDDGKGEQGFVENIAWKDGGLEKLIAKKWILQGDIDKLFENKLTNTG
jgi:DNA-directed RNA polymerase subunit RPC12/RpoP